MAPQVSTLTMYPSTRGRLQSKQSRPGTIGISTYAANALGDVVYVELPVVDADISKGDTIGAVESVKSASDLLTPISGTILETNTELEKSPGNINKSPEGESWIAKIKVKDTLEFDELMDKEAYAKFTAE
jgi:glycine cleavage system H protein